MNPTGPSVGSYRGFECFVLIGIGLIAISTTSKFRAHVVVPVMARSRTDGSYHAWRSFLRCPDCGSNDIAIQHYDEGTMFDCQHCGAEAWAGSLVEADR